MNSGEEHQHPLAGITPGIYENIPNDHYHSGPGISKSGLDILDRSPAHLHYARTAANDNKPTKAQAIGTAFHALLLEPDVFTQDYCLGLRREDVPGAIEDRDQLVAMVEELNAGRLEKLSTSGSKADLVERIQAAQEEMTRAAEWDGNLDATHMASDEAMADMKVSDLKQVIADLNKHRPGRLPISGSRHALADVLRQNGRDVTLWSDVQAEWLENNGHRTVLSQEEWDQLHGMREAVMNHRAARALLESVPGKAETSVYATDPETGLLLRCRPDWWRDDGIIVDVKTTDDASEEGFQRSLHKWRYHVQDPFYRDTLELATGRKPRAFVFLVVEKQPPHAVAVYRMDQESVDVGRAEYRENLRTLKRCEETGQWPAYGDEIQPISLPTWYLLRASER